MKYKLIALLLSLSLSAMAQDKLFESFAEKDNVTSVVISKKMFQMMPALGDIGLNIVNMAGKVESLNILTTEDAAQAQAMKKAFAGLTNDKHEELMRVKEKDTNATFYILQQGERISELIMLAQTESEFTVIRLKGDFTLRDIQEIME